MGRRPTKFLVDEAMSQRWAGSAADKAVPILQDEIHALREELDRARREFRDITEPVAGDAGFALIRHKDHPDDAAEELLREFGRRGDVIARVKALGSGPGYCMGDDTLIKLGDVRAALKGGA